MLSATFVLNMFSINLSKRMESNASLESGVPLEVDFDSSYSWRPAVKVRPNYSLYLTLVIILFVPSFGPDFSLKQCYPGKVDITILIWQLGCIMHVHTKLVLKLVFSGRVVCYNIYSRIQENSLLSSCPSSLGTMLRLCLHSVLREMLFSSGKILCSAVLNLWRLYTVVYFDLYQLWAYSSQLQW